MSDERKKAIKTDSRNKPVITTTPPESIDHQVRFEPGRFNSLVFDKAYEVFIDKAIRCPCKVKGTGGSLISCNNCLGLGWIFIDRVETRVAMQQIKADVKYENWSQTTTGMSKVTARAVDKLAFMDRIILREVEGYYSEISRARDYKGRKVLYLIYEPLEIESIYMFKGDKEPLYVLEQDDYTIDGFKLLLNDKFNSMDSIDVTVRYRHFLTYHVIDMNRDIIKVRTKDCVKTPEELQDMPISGLARKAHYIFDNVKYEEETRLIENSKKKQ